MTNRFFFPLSSKITADSDCRHETKRQLLLGKKPTKQRNHFADKDTYSQSYGLSSSYVWMWQLDSKEGWESKNWCFWTVVLEKTLRSPFDCKVIKPVKSVLNIHWKNWWWSWSSKLLATWCKELIHGKDPGAGKDWRQEEKWVTED